MRRKNNGGLVSRLVDFITLDFTTNSPKYEIISKCNFPKNPRSALASSLTIPVGYLPLILYLGYTRSEPRPSIVRLLSPLA
ncbi:hypothetical protein DID88_010242 [Monilinia fructigena]|uniref:Mitochondrial import receptor subunit TOM7 n=1 Tax=Monilinia fructigena TaxID=38457 RepID=A0A395IKW5_9HELO|nr:hypothetical protein DID88_010242 [Monilinia fructigena]